MKKIIIGIHGLANKPEKETLEKWWKESILEGLGNIKADKKDFDFKMVYWANLMYKYPLHQDVEFHFDKLFNDEPYKPAKSGALVEYKDGFLDDIRSGFLDIVGSTLDFARQKLDTNSLSEWVVGKTLRDLDFYHNETREIYDDKGNKDIPRKILDTCLHRAILEEHEAGKEIMIIAHSMGSIIAYNTLRDIGRRDPECRVKEFITIGSPLGLPYVKAQIVKERDYDPRVRTPSCVTGQWINYADKNDPVAMDSHLNDDYSENKNGVQVKDDLIRNDYTTIKKGQRKSNPHKSYGYLRAPEISKKIAGFV